MDFFVVCIEAFKHLYTADGAPGFLSHGQGPQGRQWVKILSEMLPFKSYSIKGDARLPWMFDLPAHFSALANWDT